MKLNPIHKILLKTDGSITLIIEALTGREVDLEVIEQRVVKSDYKLSHLLDIELGSEINYRVVYLKVNDDIYTKALSLIPLSRIGQDLMKELIESKLPLGKILKKYKIETRRELNWYRVISDDELSKEFKVKTDKRILARNYNIIKDGKILANITEYFPAERFSKC